MFSFLPTKIIIIEIFLQDAKKSIQFYQSLRENDANVKFIQMEINKLKCICDESKRQADGKNSLNLKDLMTTPGRRAMTIGIVLIGLNQCCGCFAMLNYAANIFKEAGTELPVNVAAIVVGLIQLLGAFLATYLVDWTGRKVCFIFISI